MLDNIHKFDSILTEINDIFIDNFSSEDREELFRLEAQLKHKFNNLLENASISDFKRLHRILDLVEVHDYSICKRPLDQHIWYNKNKIEELYQEQTKTTTDIL